MLRATCALALVAWGSPARAQQTLELSVQPVIGVDTNPGLVPAPGARGGGLAVVRPSFVVGADSSFTAGWATATRGFSFGPLASVRVFSAGEAWGAGRMAFTFGSQHGDRQLALSLDGGVYGATYGLDNAGDLGFRATLTGAARGRVRLFGAGHTRYRGYIGDPQRNVRVGLLAGARLDLDPITLVVGVDVDRRTSTLREARRWEASLRVDASARFGLYRFHLASRLYGRHFDAPSRSGAEFETSLVAGRDVGQHFVFARATVGAARGDNLALRYRRFVGLIGVDIAWRRHAAESSRQGPAVVRAGEVQFRVHAPGAQSVRLVAEFLDWNPERGVLEATVDGYFEGSFEVPPGRHAYRLEIDGELVTPPGAAAYREDDFGGRDAVLVVPDS